MVGPSAPGARPVPPWHARLGLLADQASAVAQELVDRDAVARLWARDHTLWQDDPTEVADRLGWLDGPADARAAAPALAELAAEVRGSGLREVLLCGMGGSSLFPELLARTYPTPAHGAALEVVDTTHPAAVRRAVDWMADGDTLAVVASKSGTTVETRSQLAALWDRLPAGDHFLAVTDPASELAELGGSHGFRRVVEARPDIGGRFSALSTFGMVPAALLGLDVDRLLGPADAMAAACTASDPGPSANPGLALAATMVAGAREGRDKLTVVLPPELAAFGDWLEQLVAESLGKAGAGVLPVVGEPLGPPEVYGDDRLFVSYDPAAAPALDALSAAGHPVATVDAGPAELFGEVLRWEVATALAGAALGVNPFDQPDVASAKEATARVLEGGLPAVERTPVADLLATVRAGDYVAIQAFVDPADHGLLDRLAAARVALRDRFGVAVTLGLGPRFLHSTGQYHKGGPRRGVFLQIVEAGDDDLPVPGQPFGFATLFAAQAAGDLQALADRGLRAGRVEVDDLAPT